MSNVNLKRKKELNDQIASTVMDDFDRFEYQFVTHWKQILAGGVGVVLIVAVICSFFAFRSSSENKAAAAFDRAQNTEELAKAFGEFRSSHAAMQGGMTLADLYTQEKKYDQAQATLEAVLQLDVPQEMRCRAELNLAFLLELNNQKEAAAQSFRALADREMPTLYRAEAFVNAARLLVELGPKEAAADAVALAKNFLDSNLTGGAVLMPEAQGLLVYQQQITFLGAELSR